MQTIQQQTSDTREQYLKKALRYCRKVYNERRATDRCHCSHSAAYAMRRTEEKFTDLGTFGVEGSCFSGSFTAGISYLNMGETYEPTICFRSDTERFWVGSWGDFAEANPDKFE